MIYASEDKRIVNLFTRGSHHRNLSVIYIEQNLFHQGKGSRRISLNSHYLVLFKNPREKLKILFLAKQMYPGQTDFCSNLYEEGVKRPFGYVLIDLKTATQYNCRLRITSHPVTKALTKQGFMTIFLEISKSAKSFTCPASSSYARDTGQYGRCAFSNWPSRRDDEKAKRYLPLQNRDLVFKEQLNARTRLE